MTVIAAAFNNANDYAIGADTQSEIGGAKQPHPMVKVWRWGEVLLGSAGSLAQGQRLRQHMESLAFPAITEAGLLAALESAHASLIQRTGSPGFGQVADSGIILLTVASWGIRSMDGAGATVDHGPWWAVGSGGPEARGAMWARRQHLGDCDPARLVDLGVRAAIELDTGCGGAPVVLTIESATPTVVEPNGDYVHVLSGPKGASEDGPR